MPSVRAQKQFYAGIRTNMLYDATTVPNIGAEFYVGRNITVGANWMYSWWSKERSHRYWRLYGGDVNVRYWFGPQAKEKPLQGHHAGLYAGLMTFDFEFGGMAYMGGSPGHTLWHRPIINAGLEYGYSLPIARHLNLDFTIGVGYIGGIVEKFKPVDGYYVWQSTTRQTWLGPTKVEVSLVWLIGRGNVNAGKGGRR